MINQNSFKVKVKSMVIIFAALLSGIVSANDFAIINATVYSATDQGVIKQANIVINKGKIVSVSQGESSAKKIQATMIVDAKGQIVTPGFIGVMNPLGLVEVNSESTTKDDYDKTLGINFDPSLAFNTKSTLIPLARKGGITRNISAPKVGRSLFAGQTFVANLSGEYLSGKYGNSIEQHLNGIVVKLGRQSRASRATNLQQLIDKLAKTKVLSSKKHNKEQQQLALVLKKQKPLLIYADRASDILQVIKLKQRFDINITLVGAGDAVAVKSELARAKISLIIKPILNTPANFDVLHQSIFDAGILTKAGVKVVFQGVSAHYLEQMRYNAGNAAANGMNYQEALKAITANVADVFSLNTGRIAQGKIADLILWQGNPLDLDGQVKYMWINGHLTSTKSRQDSLRDRYMKKTAMPAAYRGSE